MYFTVLALTSLLSMTLALPNALLTRQSCDETCGNTCYSAGDISAAQEQGYSYLGQGGAGGSKYPEHYENYEGFNFPVGPPYYEFPILSSGEVYNGGKPGADRVVFNDQDQLAGVVTHTGSANSDFLQCTGEF